MNYRQRNQIIRDYQLPKEIQELIDKNGGSDYVPNNWIFDNGELIIRERKKKL